MPPRFDIWVCQGRVCTAAGAGDVASTAADLARTWAGANPEVERVRVLRGGCYGLCELGPNVVVRRHEGALPDVEADRLSLTHADNESVYCGIGPAEVERVMRAHVHNDAGVPELSRAAREHELPARSPVAERLRRLRAARSSDDTR